MFLVLLLATSLYVCGLAPHVAATTYDGGADIQGTIESSTIVSGMSSRGLVFAADDVTFNGGIAIHDDANHATFIITNSRFVSGDFAFTDNVFNATIVVTNTTFDSARITFGTSSGPTQLRLTITNAAISTTAAPSGSGWLDLGSGCSDCHVTMRTVRGAYTTTVGDRNKLVETDSFSNSAIDVSDVVVSMGASTSGQQEFLRFGNLVDTNVTVSDSTITAVTSVTSVRCFRVTGFIVRSTVRVHDITCNAGGIEFDGDIDSSTISFDRVTMASNAFVDVASALTLASFTLRNCEIKRLAYIGTSSLVHFRAAITTSQLRVEGCVLHQTMTAGGGTLVDLGIMVTGASTAVVVRDNSMTIDSSGETTLLSIPEVSGCRYFLLLNNTMRGRSTGNGVKAVIFRSQVNILDRVVVQGGSITVDTAVGDSFGLRTEQIIGEFYIADVSVRVAISTGIARGIRFGNTAVESMANATVVVQSCTVYTSTNVATEAIQMRGRPTGMRLFAIYDTSVTAISTAHGARGIEFSTTVSNTVVDIARNHITVQSFGTPRGHIYGTAQFPSSTLTLSYNTFVQAAPPFDPIGGPSGTRFSLSFINLRCNRHGGALLTDMDASATVRLIDCDACRADADCFPSTTTGLQPSAPYGNVTAAAVGSVYDCGCGCPGGAPFANATASQGKHTQCVMDALVPFDERQQVTTTTAAPSTSTAAEIVRVTTTEVPTTATMPSTNATTTTTASPAANATTSLPGPGGNATVVPSNTTEPPTTPPTTPPAGDNTTTTASPLPPVQPRAPEYTPVRTLGPTSVPEPIAQGSQGSVIVAAGGSAAAAGAPGWSSHASRNAMLAALRVCPKVIEGDDELDRVVNPTGLALGSAPTRQYLGALVANYGIVLGLAMLQALVGVGLYLHRKKTNTTTNGGAAASASAKDNNRQTLTGSLLAAKLPRANYIWFLLFLQPLTQCSLVLMSASDREPSTFIAGLIGLFGSQGASLVMAVQITGSRLRARYVLRPWASEAVEDPALAELPAEIDPEERDLDFADAPANAVASAFTPRGDWFAGDSNDEEALLHHSTFKPLYAPFRRQGRLFLLADIGLALIFGVASSVFPRNQAECIAQMAVIFTAMLIYLVVVVAVRPFAVPLDNALLAILAALETASAACLVVLVTAKDEGTAQAAQEGSEILEQIAMWLTFAIMAKDIVVAVGRQYMKHQEDLERERRRVDAAIQQQQQNTGAPSTDDDDATVTVNPIGQDSGGFVTPIAAGGGGGIIDDAKPAAAEDDDDVDGGDADADARMWAAVDGAAVWESAGDDGDVLLVTWVAATASDPPGGKAAVWYDPSSNLYFDETTGWWWSAETGEWWPDEEQQRQRTDSANALRDGGEEPYG